MKKKVFLLAMVCCFVGCSSFGPYRTLKKNPSTEAGALNWSTKGVLNCGPNLIGKFIFRLLKNGSWESSVKGRSQQLVGRDVWQSHVIVAIIKGDMESSDTTLRVHTLKLDSKKLKEKNSSGIWALGEELFSELEASKAALSITHQCEELEYQKFSGT